MSLQLFDIVRHGYAALFIKEKKDILFFIARTNTN